MSFIKNYSSSDLLEQNPFNRKPRLHRSPTKKDTSPKNEINVSLAKEKVVSDSATTERLNSLEKLCEQLQKQVTELTNENERLKTLMIKNKDKEIPMETEVVNIENVSTEKVAEFHTDEDELVRETDWILQRNKKRNHKKRKAEYSPEMDTSNKSILKTNEKIAKRPKIPPVILSNITDFNKVHEVLKPQNIKYEIKYINKNQLRITVNSDDDYRILTRTVNDAKFEWHSYECKATRPCRVIARGLHPNCDIELMQEDLEDQGFNVINVFNLTRKKNLKDKQVVEKLPLFMISFDHTEDIQKIFSITHIVNSKVKIEAMRKQKERLIQCKRCQSFGHTYSYCKRVAKCVKCAGNHLSVDCTIDKKAPTKCSNCDEPHPASYRGCLVAKELLKRRIENKKNNKNKKRNNNRNTTKENKNNLIYSKNVNKNQKNEPTRKTVKGVSYSDIAKNKYSNSVPKQSLAYKSITPKSNKPQYNNKTPKKTPSTPKGQKTLKTFLSKDEIFNFHMTTLMTMMNDISIRLDKLETRSNATKHIGTPRSILR